MRLAGEKGTPGLQCAAMFQLSGSQAPSPIAASASCHPPSLGNAAGGVLKC